MSRKVLTAILLTSLLLLACGRSGLSPGLSEREAAEFDKLVQFVKANSTRTDLADTLLSCYDRIFAYPSHRLSPSQLRQQVSCHRGAMGMYLVKGRLEEAILTNLEGNSQAIAINDKELELRSSTSMLNFVSGLRMEELTDHYRRQTFELLHFSSDTANIIEALLISAGSYTNEHKLDSALMVFKRLDSFMAGDKAALDHSPNGRFLYAYQKGWLLSEIPDSSLAAIDVLMPVYIEKRQSRAIFPGYEMVCLNIGKAYEHAGMQQQADSFYAEATGLVCDYPSLLRYEAVDWLQKNYIGKKDNESSLRLLPVFMMLEEQFYNHRNASMFSVYNAQFRLAQKNNQIDIQQRELARTRWRTVLLAGLVVLLALLCVWGLLFWRDRKRKLRMLFTAIIDRQRQWQQMLAANVPQQLPQHAPEPKTALPDTAGDSRQPQEPYAEFYQRILKVMESERPFVNPDFNIEMLARLAGLNRSATSRTINTVAGQNFSNWLAVYRVNYLIERFIKEQPSESSVETFFEQAGFSSRSSYYRQFKAVTGMTPRQFREQYNMERE